MALPWTRGSPSTSTLVSAFNSVASALPVATVPGRTWKSVSDANMNALGYTRVTSLPGAGTANTVGIKVSALRGSAAVYYPGYWCDYWYYYSCYYNWYYAGSYDYGSAIIEMGDLSAPDGGTLPVLWTGVIYGVATTEFADTPRVIDGVNRAFAQSPYLRTN